ncbi:asparagine synthase (glutamine-hydrolyzing) [Erythrobacter arachoides]|uniref:asparagine synthase (glutamine-hydrolyzing) n=1 Tax=Aurantiacibacter arachoides TaxID=1850444 RepID=A0A845A1P9_9SPHN|nr:asparagine synthase (glutamine-hydrolyzing) [Aurantiacibacter arachoides]MXO93382.1 asparagine synthase (glutamine-hydrolyzing) [Aurantiacibacter arachoides]GGD49798.1 asparagine synthetase B [Aurantiacibacter arachoides]
MCGINGIYSYGAMAAPVDEDELLRTRDSMTARGPDGCGHWLTNDRRVGFAHRRLAIIDLTEGGAQPMHSASGRFVITFNGEIYNFATLRTELEGKGHAFASDSDTEVLLQLYEAMGPAMVTRLVGMFAFAIWDRREEVLFLARDPYGIKPLYYADDGGTFRFASQVKSLIAGGGVAADPDPAALVGFHLLGSVPEPLTIARAVKALPAGSWLTVKHGGASEPTPYHSIAAVFAEGENAYTQQQSPRDRRQAYQEALLDSVRRHLVADVPVGAFLSSGIDSSALVGLMRDAGQSEIETVTLSFAEYQGTPADEAPLAEQVARTYGTRHTTRVVTKAEFEADLPAIIAAMDQPSIDGINTWFVSKAARERGLKVAISGVGGDELMGGYPSFRDVPRWVRYFSAPAAIPFLGSTIRRGMMAVGPERFGISPKAAGLIEFGGKVPGAWFVRRGLRMPWDLPELLDPDIVTEGLDRLRLFERLREVLDPRPASTFSQIAVLESAMYMRNQLLRDTDWAGMAHSLEIRTPLADSQLLASAAALGPPPAGEMPKAELAFAPSTPLPDAVISRSKTGFAVPVGSWIRNAGDGAKALPMAGMRDWARHVQGAWTRGLETSQVRTR